MTQEWGPSRWGRSLTGSPQWQLLRNDLELSLTAVGQSRLIDVDDQTSYRVHQGVFWTDITLHPGRTDELKVDGLPNAQWASLIDALNTVRTEKGIREDVATLQRTHQAMLDWFCQKSAKEDATLAERRWFTHEMQTALEAVRPAIDVSAMRARLRRPVVQTRLGEGAVALEASLTLWKADHRASWNTLNAVHTEHELEACKELFDRVESKPLTEDQSRAVICFDNRVQVVASAGSGKTSTMVAKAVYAIHRGFVTPDRFVLLAFNKKAAEELKERAAKSFKRLDLEGVEVEASTFHALGLRIIGKATGEKPDIPDWATDTVGGFRKLSEIVDQLKDLSTAFRTQWDLFRFVFGRDLPAFGVAAASNVWDDQGNGLISTADGGRVRSQEEAMIANWLFLNGVDYVYEGQYQFKTADEDHRQYHPDFYYPGIKIYHEHFALDAHGEAPPHFEGYLDGVKWKRQLHQERGTLLFETTSHGIRNGNDFERLEAELTRCGIRLDPNPDRPIPVDGEKPMEPGELTGLVRTFISHAKSNCLTISALHQRLDAMPEDTFKHRHRMFLDIAAPILEAWDAALAAEGGIDFEDMLNLAAGHLESGLYEMPYDLVMADEFQDASRARARLCRALVQKPGRFLFAVGDDWQSINRFAGADVSMMTGFREWFGHGQIIKLEQTFRCPQELCDISSRFVSKNPAQISKQVRAVTPTIGPVLQAFQVDHKDKLADAIDQFVQRLAQGVRDGTIPAGANGKVSVYVLGRYNADRLYVPTRKARFERWVDVSFLTIHRSKGSEADYVVLPEMLSVLRGRSFPNNRADDPVLALAMPAGDDYPSSEERRLFYVALTRARRGVALFTVRGKYSFFLRELEAEGAVTITDTDGKAVCDEICPSCKQGVLVLRTGPYGNFRSCSNFPACTHKPKKRPNANSSATDRVIEQTTPLLPTRVSTGRLTISELFSTAESRLSLPPLTGNHTAASSSGTLTPTKNQRIQPAPADTSTPVPLRSRVASFLQAVNDGAAEINENINRAQAVQAATSQLDLDLHSERVAIEAALSHAKSAIDLEVRMQNPVFRESYELIRALHGSSDDTTAITDRPVPTFERRSRHAVPETEVAIQRKIDGLRTDREAFLSSVHAKLASSPVLYKHFLKTIFKYDGARYLKGLDPHSSLRQV